MSNLVVEDDVLQRDLVSELLREDLGALFDLGQRSRTPDWRKLNWADKPGVSWSQKRPSDP